MQKFQQEKKVCINHWNLIRSSHPELFLRKDILKICSKFTGEYKCRSAISIKLFCNFIEMALPHGCSPVNLLHILRTPFFKNTSEGLILFNKLAEAGIKEGFLQN